eukprot:1186470-Prorocentrum_minimum.AAC.1
MCRKFTPRSRIHSGTPLPGWSSVRFRWHPASAAVGWVYTVAGGECRQKTHLTPGPWVRPTYDPKVLASDTWTLASSSSYV